MCFGVVLVTLWAASPAQCWAGVESSHWAFKADAPVPWQHEFLLPWKYLSKKLGHVLNVRLVLNPPSLKLNGNAMVKNQASNSRVQNLTWCYCFWFVFLDWGSRYILTLLEPNDLWHMTWRIISEAWTDYGSGQVGSCHPQRSAGDCCDSSYVWLHIYIGFSGAGSDLNFLIKKQAARVKTKPTKKARRVGSGFARVVTCNALTT